MLENLIGAQIVEVKDNYIEVKKNDKKFKLKIKSSDGGCCGYAEFTTVLLYSPKSKRNPVITSIEKQDGNGYSSNEETSVITFFGESKPLAKIEGTAGSDSGWEYGAYVSLVCESLDIDEMMVSW